MRKTLFIALAVVSGCSTSHANEPHFSDAGGDLGNDDLGVALDAPIPFDEGVDLGQPDGGTCNLSSTSISVTATPTPGSNWTAERCGALVVGADRFEGTLLEVIGTPSVNGVVIRIDRCPNADDDCRCDYTVANVGSDLNFLTVEVPFWISGQLAENAISLAGGPVCDCVGCPCAVPLLFFAASAELNDLPVQPSVTFARGDVTCNDGDGTGNDLHHERQAMQMILFPGHAPDLIVDEGMTGASSNGFSLRVVRSSQTICYACGGVGPEPRSWAAWKAPFGVARSL